MEGIPEGFGKARCAELGQSCPSLRQLLCRDGSWCSAAWPHQSALLALCSIAQGCGNRGSRQEGFSGPQLTEREADTAGNDCRELEGPGVLHTELQVATILCWNIFRWLTLPYCKDLLLSELWNVREEPQNHDKPKFISLLTHSHPGGRLGMAFCAKPGSVVNLTVVVCFFSFGLGANSQALFCKFVDIFLVLLLLPSLHNSVTWCVMFCFAFLLQMLFYLSVFIFLL